MDSVLQSTSLSAASDNTGETFLWPPAPDRHDGLAVVFLAILISRSQPAEVRKEARKVIAELNSEKPKRKIARKVH